MGVALSDPDARLASPFTIIDCKDDIADAEAIVAIIVQQQVEEIIIGLPISMDGTTSKQTEKTQDFAQKLSNHTNIPIQFRDERLTTVSARRLKRTTNTKKTKRKIRYDAMAATLILQGYLDEKYFTDDD
ncbi:MAG: Holliday junction resolvase RuvX [Dehalococcoidales bacterium]|nr:Holliday junction resolvase RuvX [Dehalococcoidales bacterium]